MGSSQTRSVGSETIARAIETRCCWPPESSVGLCAARSARPTSCSAIAARFLRSRRRQLGQQQRQLDVLLRREHRHQVVELEDEADLGGAPLGERAAAELVEPLAADRDAAARGHVEAADEVEQRRLARARRAHQGEEVALLDVEVDVVQHLDLLLAALVHLRQVADLDQPRHVHASPALGARCCGLRIGAPGVSAALLVATLAPSCSAGGGDTTTRSPAFTPSGTSFSAPTSCAAGTTCARPPCRPRRRRRRSCPSRWTIAVGGTSTPLRRAAPRATAFWPRNDDAHAHVGHDARVLLVEADAHLHRRLAAVGGGHDRDHVRRDAASPGRRSAPPRRACRA